MTGLQKLLTKYKYMRYIPGFTRGLRTGYTEGIKENATSYKVEVAQCKADNARLAQMKLESKEKLGAK